MHTEQVARDDPVVAGQHLEGHAEGQDRRIGEVFLLQIEQKAHIREDVGRQTALFKVFPERPDHPQALQHRIQYGGRVEWAVCVHGLEGQRVQPFEPAGESGDLPGVRSGHGMEPHESRVQAVEEVGVSVRVRRVRHARLRHARLHHACACDQFDLRGRRTLRLQGPHVLGAMHAAARQAEFAVRPVKHGTVGAYIDHQGVDAVERCPRVVDVQLAGLPGTQAVPQVFGKAFRIGRDEKGFAGDPPGRLVMPVPVAGRIGEHGYDHVGAKAADDAHHVRKQHFIMIPVFQGFLGRL